MMMTKLLLGWTSVIVVLFFGSVFFIQFYYFNGRDPSTVDDSSFSQFYFERSLLPTPLVVKTVAKDFNNYAERAKKIDDDWQLTNDSSMLIFSSHMNLGGNHVVSIVMHEGETHNYLKPEYFNLTALKSPLTRTLYCVFPDGSISVGRLEEWNNYSEYLWMIKCRINFKVAQQYVRYGVMNYLLVDASATSLAGTESDDFSQNVLGNFIVKASDRPNPPRPIKLMLCSSPLSEQKAPFLKEWIEYYRLMGVEHFAFYNYTLGSASTEIIDPYIKAGIIRSYKWHTPGFHDPNRSGQIPAHNDCLYRYKDIAEWLIYVDVDEFILPVNDFRISDVLERYDGVVLGSIGVRGMLFGGSPDSGDLVIEKFTMRAETELVRHWRSKFIARAAYMTIAAVHWGEGGVDVDISADTLRMNHYYNAHRIRDRIDDIPTPVKDITMPKRFAATLKKRIELPPGL